MTTTIRPKKLNHLNMVLEDFDASVVHFTSLYDAQMLLDLPSPASHACLLEIGRVIFEPFVPAVWLLNARYGAHYVGVEYQANLEQVRAAIAERDIRIVRDIGMALHTHPADTLGVAFEFYDGEFHENSYALLGDRQIRSADYWRDEHPLGLTGLKAYTLAVHDLPAAQHFVESFLGAEPIYQAARPSAGALAIGLRVGDSVIELLGSTGPGRIADHLYRFGDGIYSTVFGTRDIALIKTWFADRNVAVEPGTADGTLAVAASSNRGVIFEFAE